VISKLRRAPKTFALASTMLFLTYGSLSNAANATNAAMVAAPAGSTDPKAGSKSANHLPRLGSTVAVTATKSVIFPGPYEVGDTIFYNIVLTNSGTGTQLDNPGDEFVDTLPAGLTLVDATATFGTITTAGNALMWNGTIASFGGFFSISVEALIDAGTNGQTLSNQGTVHFDADGNGTNESSGMTDDPAVPGAADPTDITVGVPPPVAEIPTLSVLGVAALAVILAGLALAVLRRRRTV
jgi:uncharacterized repeat protein (TIGR01451 family)